MGNKQTAVQLLSKPLSIIVQKLCENGYESQEEFTNDWISAFNYAAVIEKQQIIDAHFEGWGDAYDYLRDESPDARQAQDYYEETYLENEKN